MNGIVFALVCVNKIVPVPCWKNKIYTELFVVIEFLYILSSFEIMHYWLVTGDQRYYLLNVFLITDFSYLTMNFVVNPFLAFLVPPNQCFCVWCICYHLSGWILTVSSTFLDMKFILYVIVRDGFILQDQANCQDW